MISTEKLREQFRNLYGRQPVIFSAPGRVNLIGEHTDYNDGFVLPMAIDRRTFVAAAARDDRLIRCVSTEFEGNIQFELNANLEPAADWANHIRGVAACLLHDAFDLRGADLLIASDVPRGAGLSSSAALEVATGYALLRLAEQPVDPVNLALTAQRAEQEFTGTRCGIMDQYIACLGIKNHALLIDCRSLEYRAVAIDSSEARIIVCNSLVKHELADSEYNQRRAECEEGVRLLAKDLLNIMALRDVEPAEFDLFAGSLPEVIRRRCNHVITENARTMAAVEALECGDMVRFGQLMYASHRSLREDYEVSCRELDLLVEIASRYDGVLGARMTGGGFGGCTVNLVETGQVENFISVIIKSYELETGIEPQCYVCLASEGMKEE
ncbi:MAG: galactokinase [Acidobacteria bacterium]|nr:galactokinase [Acidobacteriota bacterium]MCI0666171.1 galactokinase [Acidobacteriota bacterium]